jgi:uncharacterized protein (UPF0179 family)
MRLLTTLLEQRQQEGHSCKGCKLQRAAHSVEAGALYNVS